MPDENELQKGQEPKWDLTSPYFRRAVREAHEESDQEDSAMSALHDAVSDALASLDAQFGTELDGGDLAYQLTEEIADHFSDQAEADDKEIAEDEKAEQEEAVEEAAAQQTRGVQ